MARSIAAIKLSLSARFIQEPAIITMYGLDTSKTFEQQFSKLSFESILFDIIAFAIWTLEGIYDNAIVTLTKIANEGRGPYLPWYITSSLNFQYGYSLPSGGIKYDNTGIEQGLIVASKVVKYAAANGILKGVRLKIAGESNGELSPLPPEQLEAFEHYWSRIMPPGLNRLIIINTQADQLKVHVTAYYNPELLNGSGQRIDGSSNTPLRDAVDDFCKNQVFNGRFDKIRLEDAMQAVKGIDIPVISLLQAKYENTAWIDIPVSYTPNAGYLRLTEFEVTYLPNTSL